MSERDDTMPAADALAPILDLCDEAEKAGSHVTRLASIQAIRAAFRAAAATASRDSAAVARVRALIPEWLSRDHGEERTESWTVAAVELRAALDVEASP